MIKKNSVIKLSILLLSAFHMIIAAAYAYEEKYYLSIVHCAFIVGFLIALRYIKELKIKC